MWEMGRAQSGRAGKADQGIPGNEVQDPRNLSRLGAMLRSHKLKKPNSAGSSAPSRKCNRLDLLLLSLRRPFFCHCIKGRKLNLPKHKSVWGM